MPNQVVTRISVAGIALAGLWLAWTQQPAPAQLTLEKITENLYVISNSGGNVAVMPTSEGVILVDDKFVQDSPQILAKVKSITDKPIRYVLNTHQHGDHTGGNAPLLAANAEILIHKQARANMVAGNMPGIPRIAFNDESLVFLGGKEVMARHLGRGHTNGDSVVYFPSERAIHMGDLFTNAAPFCDYTAGASIKDWDKTLQKAMAYDFDIAIPGHGPVMKKADVAKYIQNIALIRDRAQKACKAGPPADALSRIDLKDIGLTTAGAFARGFPAMCNELN